MAEQTVAAAAAVTPAAAVDAAPVDDVAIADADAAIADADAAIAAALAEAPAAALADAPAQALAEAPAATRLAAADHDRIASDIYRALADERFDDAIGLAEQHWGSLVSFNVAVLRAVADRLSPADLAARPAWDRIKRILNYMMLDATLRPAAYVEAPVTGAPKTLADAMLMLTTKTISVRTNGRLGEAVGLVREAQRRFDEARPADRDALMHRMADAFQIWGMTYELAADEEESLPLFERAYSLGLQHGNTRASADAAGELAWLHALAGRGPTADLWIARARAIAEPSRNSDEWKRGDLIASAVRHADQMRPDLALKMLDTRSGTGVDEHRIVSLAQSVVFRLSAGLASPTLLRSELRRAALSDAALLIERGANTIVLGYVEALVDVYGNRPDRAVEVLDRVTENGGAPYVLGLRAAVHLAVGAKAEASRDAEEVIAEYGQWPRQWIPALLVKATLALEAGDEAAAVSAFRDACTIALDNGLVASLLVIPHADFARLLPLAGDRLSDPRLETLSHTPLVFAPARRTAAHLSPRELGVLRELARGGPLAEVARRLHVSVNTLKVHNHAIYRKLGADGRERAVAIGRDRGLI